MSFINPQISFSYFDSSNHLPLALKRNIHIISASLSLYRPGSQSLHNSSLEDENKNHNRYCNHYRASHDLAKGNLSRDTPCEQRNRDGNCPCLRRNSCECKSKYVLVPGSYKCQLSCCYQGRRCQRQQDHIESLEWSCTVDPCRLHNLRRKLFEKSCKNPCCKRQSENHIREDQTQSST